MDLRIVAMVMAIAIIMEMLGRMARKRAAEQQQGLPGEELDMLQALAEGQEPPGPAAGEARPARREVAGGFELWSETPRGPGARDPVEREPVVEPAAPEPVFRDRAARPIVVRSREPRPVERIPERAVPEAELVVRARQLPAPPPEQVRPVPPRLPASLPPAAPGSTRPRRRAAGPEDPLGLGTIDGLRKALVAREVLGPPLALRDDDGRIKGR